MTPQPLRDHERWIWTELIGFDAGQDDFGVAEYLQDAGFVPTGICLLITSPDFILSHQDTPDETELPADFCARDGHEFNQQRRRQVWTSGQLKGLIRELHARGVLVYLTVFTRFYGNRLHHEWVSDHREVCGVYRHHGWAAAINVLSRMGDGGYFEDYFIAQLVRVLGHYGFDGWHGADGFGPLSGPIYEVPVSDDMVGQFAAVSGIELPEVVTRECGHEIELLEARTAWLWAHARHEWIEFFADRWARFWRKATGALHAAAKTAFINSSWGRAPFESLYRYGIDYRRIVGTGVDGIVVETVCAGLAMDPRPGAGEPAWHFDFLSMLMLIRGCVPDAKLIFLHNTHDVVEEWDAIHHIPMILEREIYSLANVLYADPQGGLRPCADGLLVCLGDGLTRSDWEWLRDRWRLAFGPIQGTPLGATLIWSDAVLDGQVDDFARTRTWHTHRILFSLMERGAPVQAIARIEALPHLRGPILVLNPHLMSGAELQAIRSYTAGPIIAVGRKEGLWEGPDFAFGDAYAPDELWCAAWGMEPPESVCIEPDGPEETIPDPMAILEPRGYWERMQYRIVSESFLTACAGLLQSVCGVTVSEPTAAITLMGIWEDDKTLVVALKSKADKYTRPVVDPGRTILSADILTGYPSTQIRPEGSTFSVRVPARGITVVRVHLEP